MMNIKNKNNEKGLVKGLVCRMGFHYKERKKGVHNGCNYDVEYCKRCGDVFKNEYDKCWKSDNVFPFKFCQKELNHDGEHVFIKIESFGLGWSM